MVSEETTKIKERLQMAESEILSKSMILTNQSEEHESQILKLQSEISDYKRNKTQQLECTKIINTKLQEEQGISKRLKQDKEELNNEIASLKQKIQSQQGEIGKLLNERNESGEIKSKMVQLTDQFSRKEKEINDYQLKYSALREELQNLQSLNKTLMQEKLNDNLKSQSTADENSTMAESKLKESQFALSELNNKFENIEKKFQIALQGNEYLQNEKKRLQEVNDELEKEKKNLVAEIEKSLRYKEDVGKQMQEIASRSGSDYLSLNLLNMFHQFKQLFPDLVFTNQNASVSEHLKNILDYFTVQSKYYISVENFKDGDIVLVYPNSNGVYELATSGNIHYVLDPDCYSTWNVKMSKKESFIGQIVVLFECTSKGQQVSDFYIPQGMQYYQVTVAIIIK